MSAMPRIPILPPGRGLGAYLHADVDFLTRETGVFFVFFNPDISKAKGPLIDKAAAITGAAAV